MQPGHFNSLLPEQFRHKTTRVRVFQPQIILADFHGTISERRWEDQVIVPYVHKTIVPYLTEHLNEDEIQNCLAALRQESYEVGIRHKYDEAPIIEAESEELDQAQLARQVGDFVLWQMRAKKETKESFTIQRLVWLDGFRRGKILTPVFDDVMPMFRKWHDEYNCKIYLTSSLDIATLRTLMNNTSQGSIDSLLAGYLTSKKVGDKLLRQTYKKFYHQAMSDVLEQNNALASHESSESSGRKPKAASSPVISYNHKQKKGVNNKHLKQSTPPGATPSPSTQQPKQATDGPAKESANQATQTTTSIISPVSSLLSESNLAKPILYLTDSGQEAKAASSVSNGSVFECLLVNRPGNKRIRSYYLSQFQYIERFDDIEFV